MNFYKNIKFRNIIGYVLALILVIFISVSSYRKVKELKEEESLKVSNYAKTLEVLNTEVHLPPQTQIFLVRLIEQNTTIPVILVDEKGNYIDSKNIDSKIISNPQRLKEELQKMKELYKPILIKLPFGKQYVYYKNSNLLQELQYYPFILILIILLFIWFTYWYFNIIWKTEQSLLWAGMAKETAHQIGTPLSSIMGWLEILKQENIDQKPIKQIERDTHRLQTIVDRFSKIGSVPTLKEENIIEVSFHSFMYLKSRVSKEVSFQFEAPDEPIYIKINISLFNWVIENLVKNAVDAMKGKGEIILKIQDNRTNIYIDITDSGGGISIKHMKKIFKPGFTTKKRGWGLGLSLAKRIIQEYHHGKIFVLSSEYNKGTTFRMILGK